MIVEVIIRKDDGEIVAGPMFFSATSPYVWRTMPDHPVLEPASPNPQEPNNYALYAFTYQPTVVLRPKAQAVPLANLGPKIL